MTETHRVVLGNRGEFVVPAEVRASAGLAEGTPMVLVESPDGLILLTREQVLARVRDDLAGLDLVGELLAERRRAVELEDAG